jgi:hypothetical protein
MQVPVLRHQPAVHAVNTETVTKTHVRAQPHQLECAFRFRVDSEALSLHGMYIFVATAVLTCSLQHQVPLASNQLGPFAVHLESSTIAKNQLAG